MAWGLPTGQNHRMILLDIGFDGGEVFHLWVILDSTEIYIWTPSKGRMRRFELPFDLDRVRTEAEVSTALDPWDLRAIG